jgi:hypothetical protein
VARACLSVFTSAAARAGRSAPVADDGTVMLSITGGEGAQVRGWCRVETPEGELRVELDEAVPVERRWRASGLRCELDARGPVIVEAGRGGARGRTSTRGGRITIALG